MSELLRLLADARAGQGGVALVSGDPGVGKTRVLLELADAARTNGVSVLFGRAYDSEGMPPYYPLSEALRDYVRACPLDRLQSQLGPSGWDVALVVRDLGERLPDLTPGPRVNPNQERFRLFDSLCDFLTTIARSTPDGLLLCLDDLHWADTSTLLLLRHLARKIARAPLLVVGTHRVVDVGADHPLAGLLGDLSREQLYHRLPLAALSLAETGDLVDRIGGGAAAPVVVQALYERTGGNPFFLGELIRHLRHEGHDLADPGAATATWGIPEGVRQVIRGRCARLDAEANRLLQMAAVLGEAFSFDVLAAMDDPHDAGKRMSLVAALEGALLSGLVREQEKEHSFAHALVRETIYEGLSVPRRQGLHLRAADAIAHVYAPNPDAHIAEIAHHLLEAGRLASIDRTVEACFAAAQRARDLFAWEERAGFCRLALRALDQSGARDPGRRCDVLLALGEALLSAREPRRAADDIAPQALHLAESLNDRVRASHACRLALDGLVRHGGAPAERSPAYLEWAQRASYYAAPGSLEQIRADLALANHRVLTGKEKEAWQLSSRALQLARELADPETLFRAAWQIMMWTKAPRHQAELLRLAEESLEWATDGVNPGTVGQVLWYSALVFLESGQRARFQQLARTVEDLAARTGEPSLLWRPHVFRMIEQTLDGRLETVPDEADRFVHTGAELGVAVMAEIQAAMWSGRARLYLGPTAAILQAPTASGSYMTARKAVAFAHMNRLDDARRAIRNFLDEFDVGSADDETGMNLLAELLEAAVLVGERDAAARIVHLLEGLAGQLHTSYCALTCISRHVASAHALAGETERAGVSYLEALDVCDRVGFRPEAALTHLALAELLLSPPRLARSGSTAARAVEHLEVAVTELQAMNMRPALARALRIAPSSLRRHVLESSGGAADARTAVALERPASTIPGGLTPRELEVLRLVAAGKSSREIGEDLVLSVRTVERHISNIYLKLDVRTRTQAAAFAHRHGLVSDP